MKLTELKGVGPKTEELFRKLGVDSVESLLRYYPVHYDQYLPPVACGAVTVGAVNAVEGVIARKIVVRPVKHLKIVTTEISDPTGKLKLTWFNAPFMRNVLRPGMRFIFRGTVQERKGVLVMDHPEVITPMQYEQKVNTLVPIYSLTKGITSKTIAKIIGQAVDSPVLPVEYLPETIMRSNGLTDETWAVRTIHFPKTAGELKEARKRLVFDEFFLFVLAMRKLKEEESREINAFPMKKTWETENLIAALPYKLTGAQMRVWGEIEQDLAGDKLMSRLIQGDVGSGKTILAFLSMVMTAENGYQSALMAPTEVLAKQHYEKLMKMKETHGLDSLKPVLVTGSMRAAERRDAAERIAMGLANAVIGTHALIQEGLSYKDLALVITDEQHRFGVHQRKALSEKGEPPNAMVMSATPIPRTLGVIYYGDLDISIIDELPAKRLPIKNAVVDLTWKPSALKFIGKEAAAGRQIYIICPMIEESEGLEAVNVIDETEEIRRVFPKCNVGMLHGRMKPEEKNRVMEQFAAGEIDILVSTTVVEVGVDVPNATVMMIENAERFGLATLHQLRGRVGRGKEQSYCIFMAGQKSEKIKERLDILAKSNNGFEIAEKDFEMRGPGDLLGIRQSGDAMFHLADVSRDQKILELAGKTAANVLHDDPLMISEDYELLGKALREYLAINEKNIVL